MNESLIDEVCESLLTQYELLEDDDEDMKNILRMKVLHHCACKFLNVSVLSAKLVSQKVSMDEYMDCMFNEIKYSLNNLQKK